MAINGRDSNGDADRNLEELEDDYLPPNFREYLRQEEFNSSRHKLERLGVSIIGWVFWSQKDHEIEPSLSRDNCPGFNPKVGAILNVRDNIRDALTQMILKLPEMNSCLVQFWAPITTSEGRTVLVSQYQPFAFGTTASMSVRQKLSEYKMKVCREYSFFYADAESREEQLGLPGRVFLHKYPESTPDVKYYSTKEYPQRDLALRCKITGSWAVPVFEHSSRTCVGVLEIVDLYSGKKLDCLDDWEFKVFKEFGLQCSDQYKICEMQCREKIKREGLTPAFQELHWALRSVCEIHKLPLGVIWVPCGACNGLLQGPVWSKDGFFTGIEKYEHTHSPLNDFLGVGKNRHLRNGWVARTVLSSPDMLYFPDLTKLSVDEYPLVPYARMHKFRGWFIICLQRGNTGDDIYVLEFFWSSSSKDNQDILTRLNKILGTMEEKLENFRFASGRKLGYRSSVEVIDVQNDQKIHSVHEIQSDRTFSDVDSEPSFELSSSSVNMVM